MERARGVSEHTSRGWSHLENRMRRFGEEQGRYAIGARNGRTSCKLTRRVGTVKLVVPRATTETDLQMEDGGVGRRGISERAISQCETCKHTRMDMCSTYLERDLMTAAGVARGFFVAPSDERSALLTAHQEKQKVREALETSSVD